MTYNIINLDQNTPEWHKFRAYHIGASDAPVIMRKSPWMTPEELYEIRTGFKEPRPMTAKMQRGHDLEDEARKLLIERAGINFTPIVIEDEEDNFLSCSLDGISDDFNIICEIKCPNSKTHRNALNGIIPEYYNIQIQHQLMVSRAKYCIYFSYRPEESNPSEVSCIILVQPDPELISKIFEKELEFWDRIVNLKTPEGCWKFKEKK